MNIDVYNSSTHMILDSPGPSQSTVPLNSSSLPTSSNAVTSDTVNETGNWNRVFTQELESCFHTQCNLVHNILVLQSNAIQSTNSSQQIPGNC